MMTFTMCHKLCFLQLSLVNVGLCCAVSAAAGTTLRIVLLYRISCACNKTTDAGANHSDCLCLATRKVLVAVV